MKNSFFKFQNTPDTLELRAVEIFETRLQKRGVVPDPECSILVVRNKRCTAEEFRFSGSYGSKNLQLDCGSPAAFLYAAGKLLRTGCYADNIFSPGEWRGVWRPEKTFRCVYFASHFYNFYEVAPIEMIEEYLEDLALLGYNNIELSPGSAAKIHNSPETLQDLARCKQLWKYASSLAMKITFYITNHGYDDSPQKIRATSTGHSFFGTEVCPSDPDGMEYLINKFHNNFESIKDIPVDNIVFWPYDQGGCKCSKCHPYGAKGMFTLAEKLLPLIREYWPGTKITWGTWEFDWQGEDLGEWSTLYHKLNNGEADFISYIMADSHNSFPEYPLQHPLPARVGLITFPEISMWGRAPWGGFGATPLPKRFSQLFGEIAHLGCGGILYSEGIFEDFNKELYANFFISGTNETDTAIREYARYKLGLPESSLDEFKRLLELMEDNHQGVIWVEEISPAANEMFERMKNKPIYRMKGKRWNGTSEMLELAKKLDSQLPAWSRNHWCWRLFYLRAVIDFELAHNDNETNEITEKAMLEIADIYHIDPRTASRRVSPFTDEWIKYHVKENYKFNIKTVGVD